MSIKPIEFVLKTRELGETAYRITVADIYMVAESNEMGELSDEVVVDKVCHKLEAMDLMIEDARDGN